jgi:hypothetical protein
MQETEVSRTVLDILITIKKHRPGMGGVLKLIF